MRRPIPKRLDKHVRECTALSVAETREALAAGRVGFEGCAGALEADSLVYPEDRVTLDGAVLARRNREHFAMLNKPKGVTSTLRDPRRQRDLGRWVAEMPPGTFPIGRLDRETTGLLLFTTDGDFASALTRPEHGAPKTYWLWIDDSIDAGDPRLSAFRSGVQISSGLATAREVSVLRSTDAYTELLVTLEEGKNRQIRKMCFEVGFRLVGLHRRSIGPVGLGDLTAGDWRFLNDDEVDGLWAAVGGREAVRSRQVAALRRQADAARVTGRPLVRLERWLEGDQGPGSYDSPIRNAGRRSASNTSAF